MDKKEKLTKEEKKEKRIKTLVYVILRLAVVLVMIAQIFNDNWNNVFLCILTLILFMIPSFVDRRLHIELPTTLEIIIVVFIFSAEILGEIQEYYLIFDNWDTILHTTNGFIMAAIGFSLIDILNENENVMLNLSPAFVAIFAFCFSMTIGVLWEFFEFFMDYFFKTDMQKDTFVPWISSVLLNPQGANVAVTWVIDSVVVNGQTLPGYIDIGLYDTMKDLLVNFIGAVVFSVFGLIYIKNRNSDKPSFASRFIPRRKKNNEKDKTQLKE